MNDSPENAGVDEANLTLPKRKGWLGRVGCVTLLVLVCAVPVGLLVLSAWSLVIGEEFSPNTFESRRFSYSRLPLLGTPLSKRTVDDSTSVPQQLLLSGGLIADPGGEPRWDLVSDNWQPEYSADFDAAILVSYLRMTRADGESFWPAWNDEHPGQAAIFWPLVAELARERAYLALPPLFRIAMQVDGGKPDANEFAGLLYPAAVTELRQLAPAEQGAGNADRASRLEQLANRLEAGPPITQRPVP